MELITETLTEREAVKRLHEVISDLDLDGLAAMVSLCTSISRCRVVERDNAGNIVASSEIHEDGDVAADARDDYYM